MPTQPHRTPPSLGDRVALWGENETYAGRHLGVLVSTDATPSGIKIGTVRVGPNPHELQSYCMSALTALGITKGGALR